jgi:hypothetical protein
MWKEEVVILFNALTLHSLGGTEENHKELSQGSRSADRVLYPEPVESNGINKTYDTEEAIIMS